jgi:hypothetical protein
MNDTPRTAEAQFGTGRVSVSFAAQLERELSELKADADALADALKLCSQVIGSPNEDPPKWPSIEDCDKAWNAAKSAFETYRTKYQCTH